MRDNYNRNEIILMGVNIVVFLILALLTLAKEDQVVGILLIFIVLINAVCTISLFTVVKKVRMNGVRLFKYIISVSANVASYAILILTVMRLFGGN